MESPEDEAVAVRGKVYGSMVGAERGAPHRPVVRVLCNRLLVFSSVRVFVVVAQRGCVYIYIN